MKKSKGTNPCVYTESVGKAKSRIKRLEKHNAEGCNHRLANTYANNQPGEVPKIAKGAQYDFNVMKGWASAAGAGFDKPQKPGRMWPSGEKPSEAMKKHDAEVKKSLDYYRLKEKGRKGED